MALQEQQLIQIDQFLNKSDYLKNGAVITDLDGTAVHDLNGITIIHKDVGWGLKKVYDAGRPVVINTLRFPLSVIRTFARDWYKISASSIPVVLLNGSQLGYIVRREEGFVFDQLKTFPLSKKEIVNLIDSVDKFRELMNDVVVFYYPEDWMAGEKIWTPVKEKIPYIQNKYKSASSVVSTPFSELQGLLNEQPVCMILLLINAPDDKLMAYEHTKRNNFFTRESVDKKFGAEQMAKLMGFDLESSVGAGDSAMDVFLSGTGLSVHVRNKELPFKGRFSNLILDDFHDFGSLLEHISSAKPVPAL